MRAPTTVLLLAAAVPALAQYDPTAPRPSPRLRGVVVAAGGPTTSLALRHFVRQAGDPAQIVVVDPDDVLAIDWHALGAAEVTVVRDLGAALDARAVWLELPEALVDSRAGALGALGARVLARGGVVGANEVCARAAGTWRLATAAPPGRLRPHAESFVRGFDWFRGALLLTGDAARDRALVDGVLAARPDVVALAVPTHCVLTIDERRLTGHGQGSVRAFVAPTAERATRVDTIGAGRDGTDMLTYERIAQQRASGPFPAAAVRVPRVASGTLVLVGGGAIPEDVLRRFVRLAGGAQATIVCVPCAYEEELARPPSTVDLFRRLGAGSVTWVHTKDRAAADTDEELLAPLRAATGIWFGGGRQWNLVDSYQNTKAHELMEGVLARGGVIAGSSAGASIQAEYLCRGNPLGNREIMWEGYDRGLGFLPGVGVDQHFSQRGRQEDMESLVRAYPQLLGIGIDEGTALVVRETTGEVLGAGHVWFFDHSGWDRSGDHTGDHTGDRTGDRTGEAPVLVQLGAGARYDLAARAAARR